MKPVPSSLLVTLQFALMALLIASTEALATPITNAIAFALVLAGTFVGVAALAANRPGNFNIRPELKDSARLITDGIYAHVRHPMYLAVLLVMAAAIAADPRPWRIVAWLLLFAVLVAKLRREETYLQARFPDYADHMQRSARLIPRVY